MTTTTMSVRLPGDLFKELELLAKATKRTKSFCAVEAIKSYIERESWQIKFIEEGIEDTINDRLVEHQDVKKWVASWNTDNEMNEPQCK